MLQVIDRDNLKKKYKYIGKKTTEAVFMYATNKQWNSFKMSKQKSKSTKMKLKT